MGWWIWSSYQNRSEFRRICTKYQLIILISVYHIKYISIYIYIYIWYTKNLYQISKYCIILTTGSVSRNWYTDILDIIHQVRSHRNICAARVSTQIAIFDGDVASFEHVQNPTCLVLESWFGFGNTHIFLGRRKKYLKAVQKTGTCLVPGRWLYPILDIFIIWNIIPFLLFSNNNIWNHQPG